MSADLIDGKAFAARVRAEVASGVAALKARWQEQRNRPAAHR